MKLLKSIGNLFSGLMTFLLSVVLAFSIWVAATQADDPTIIKPVQLALTIPVPSDAALITPNSNNLNITLTVEGRASVVEDITGNDFTTAVDLSEVIYGEDTAVDIIVAPLTQDVIITSQDPLHIDILLEELITREIPIDVEIRGSVARGHSRGAESINPKTISVTGIQSEVDALDYALITMFLNNTRETITESRPFILYDKQGQVASVRNFQLSSRDVEVTIPISEAEDFAEKLISIDLEGAPALGYRLLSVTVEPSSVLVQGRPTQLDALTQLRTEPVDITGLTESFVTAVALDLPSGVILDEITEIVVTVEIEPFQSSQTFRRFVEVQGLADGLEAKLSADTVAVILFGPSPVLQTLDESEVVVSLDLFGLDVGSYSGLVPTVTFPDRGIELRSFNPATISAIITQTATMTDTGTISPTSALPLFMTTVINADREMETAVVTKMVNTRHLNKPRELIVI